MQNEDFDDDEDDFNIEDDGDGMNSKIKVFLLRTWQ